VADDGDRTRFWPLIEKRTGKPMDHWFAAMDQVEGRPYPEQMAFLMEEHGFARSHANALVQFRRGSASSRRFGSLGDYLAGADPAGAATIRAIFDAVLRIRPDAELVIAWNQPMARVGDRYVFGASLGRRHVLIAPWDQDRLEALRPRLEADGYVVNRKTMQVPLDWGVDEDLLAALEAARAA
jgi:uncharacterized protein YdhG (YjbR/CyaY superfamily)